MLDVRECVNYATRVARRMSRDPEVEAIANTAGWKAATTYDPTRNVPWKRWVAYVVKVDVWYYWRKLATKRETSTDWTENEDEQPLTYDEEPGFVWTEGFQMLVESCVLRWPLDVIAREHRCTIYRVRKMIQEARNALK